MSTLDVPGARLYFEVRGEGPLVMLVPPMNGDVCAGLADRLAADHTVLTTDLRGIGRSRVDDPDQDSTVEMRAEDLSRLLTHLDAGPAAVFGACAGAVSALALAQVHPEQVHTFIAYEPVLIEVLEDREHIHAEIEDVLAILRSGDEARGLHKLMDVFNVKVPEDAFAGEPDPQTAANARHNYAHMMRPNTRRRPDLDALRSAPTRIVVGIGEESAAADQLWAVTSAALAAVLGGRPLMFPGDHYAYSYPDHADAFATRLRDTFAS